MPTRKNFIYFLISIFLLSSLIFIIKTINFKNNSNILRNLVLDKARTYSCDKAGSRLLDKYEGGFEEEVGDVEESLNEAQQSIIDFIKDSSYSNIKPYLKRVAIFIIFLVLAFIFIILWITYCSCCLYNCGIFSKVDEPNKYKPLIIFLISSGFSLLAVIFSITVLILLNPFFSRLNGLFCSILTLLNHLNDGLSPQYPPHASEWLGLPGTAIKFNESEHEFQKINFDYIQNLYHQVREKCDSPGNDCICNADGVDLFTDYHSFNTLIRIFFVDLGLPSKIAKLIESKNIIDDTIIDIGEDIYDFLNGYGNKHIRNCFIAIFTLTLIIGILSLIFLCLYYFLKKEEFKIIYITIWNISMLLMIFAVVISSFYGVLGYVFKDFVQIVHYALSKNNLESDNPIIFNRKDSFLSNIIDKCANGGGIFLNVIEEGMSDLNTEIQDDFQNTLNIINGITCESELRESFVELYNLFSEATNKVLGIYEDLFHIRCDFAKNDKNIILNEMKSAGNRAIVISAFQFLIAIFIGLSILSGILLVHKYNFKSPSLKINDININND